MKSCLICRGAASEQSTSQIVTNFRLLLNSSSSPYIDNTCQMWEMQSILAAHVTHFPCLFLILHPMFFMKMKITTAVLSQIRKICPFGLVQLSFQISLPPCEQSPRRSRESPYQHARLFGISVFTYFCLLTNNPLVVLCIFVFLNHQSPRRSGESPLAGLRSGTAGCFRRQFPDKSATTRKGPGQPR